MLELKKLVFTPIRVKNSFEVMKEFVELLDAMFPNSLTSSGSHLGLKMTSKHSRSSKSSSGNLSCKLLISWFRYPLRTELNLVLRLLLSTISTPLYQFFPVPGTSPRSANTLFTVGDPSIIP